MNDVHVSGPIFDGRAESELARYIEDLADRLGQEGVDRVQRHLDGVLKHQTGHYRSSIAYNDNSVTDAFVVYGPWLEGTGSRNSPATRFSGYHTFRIVGQELDRAAEEIADKKLHEGYLERMQ